METGELTRENLTRRERSSRKGWEWRRAPMFQVSLTMGLSDFVACCECLDDQIYSVMVLTVCGKQSNLHALTIS